MLRDLGFGKPEEHWLSKIAVLTSFDAEFRKRTAFAFLPQSRSVEIMLMRFKKKLEKWNGRELLAFL